MHPFYHHQLNQPGKTVSEEIHEKLAGLRKFPELAISELLAEARKPLEAFRSLFNEQTYVHEQRFRWPSAWDKMPWQQRFNGNANSPFSPYRITGMVAELYHATDWLVGTLNFARIALSGPPRRTGETFKANSALLRQCRKALAQTDELLKFVDQQVHARAATVDAAEDYPKYDRHESFFALRIELSSIFLALTQAALETAKELTQQTGNKQIEAAWMRKHAAQLRKCSYATTGLALKLEGEAKKLAEAAKSAQNQAPEHHLDENPSDASKD